MIESVRSKDKALHALDVPARRPLMVMFLVALAWLGPRSQATAQELSRTKFKSGLDLRTAFENIVAGARRSTVRVQGDGKDVALATVVDADGFLITKASELKQPLTCLVNGRGLPAKIVGVQKEYDLAMLKVDAKVLTPVEWATPEKAAVGQWVATVGTDKYPQALGAVSVPDRRIRPSSGVLGIKLDEKAEGPRIDLVFPDSGAEKAGLKKGDLITRVEDHSVDTREKLISTIRRYKPGDVVRLLLLREGKEVDVTATLGRPEDVTNRGSAAVAAGALSLRRAGFPTVFQHDTVLKTKDCGGPLVDLSGKVVGINIARAGRTASFAIPAAKIKPLLAELKSGKLAPANAEAKKKEKPDDKPPENRKNSK